MNSQAGVSPVQEAGPMTLVGFVLEVTDSRKPAAGLLQAQKMEAIGQLAGGIAHDFNNLLGVIHGFSTFVHDDLPEGDARRDDMEMVLTATNKATALTRQLLAFSRPQVSSRRPLDLNHSLTNLHPILRSCVEENIEVQLKVSPHPAVVSRNRVGPGYLLRRGHGSRWNHRRR